MAHSVPNSGVWVDRINPPLESRCAFLPQYVGAIDSWALGRLDLRYLLPY